MMTDITEQEQDRLRNTPAIIEIREDPRPRFQSKFLESLNVRSAVKDTKNNVRMVLSFVVQHEYLNRAGTLHGAAQTLFFDIGTTMLLSPIARAPTFWSSLGISSSLNVTYLRPAMEGESLLMKCETVRVGKSMAVLRGTIFREKDNAAISTCEHIKYNVDLNAKL
ncbi:hypothetical protein K461DRAFT_246253 [Myriangium duriaei CBS 260.36]|uniref:Thioesterase domain-containing protein n=1 Tax=Myriangium duriaei CBS 260.36 TaxID=1168546 RepID=A0A9P4MGZ1_9PEZI|nr:hypothetical protein K461DRAFT_246253 [Myriangium duriaei CBS 260.36]